ncbi:EamA family transporter [Candidatus Micrarchaeota archaeon]|nr:EamA family transporter [Candidatus Micrarchaeota archaeon]
MLWVLLAVVSGFFNASKDTFQKRAAIHADDYVIALSVWLFALPVFLIALAIDGIPIIGNGFWLAVVLSAAFNSFAYVLGARALRVSPISIVGPMLALTPAWLLLLGPLLIGENPTVWGAGGVLLVMAGTYFMRFGERKKGFLEPFKALAREPGVRMMIVVTFLFGISSILDKIALKASSPVFYITILSILLSAILFTMARIKSKSIKPMITKVKHLVPIGVLFGLSLIAQMIAFSLTIVVYATSLKRSDMLFSIIYGKLLFKEKEIKSRLLGASIMLAGALLIIFKGRA